MSGLQAWFLEGARTRSLLWCAPFLVFGKLMYALVMTSVLLAVAPDGLSNNTMDAAEFLKEHGLLKTLFAASFLGPIVEEFLFRLLPLGFGAFVLMVSDLTEEPAGLFVMLLIATVTSVFFGLVHGTAANVLLQGAGGLLYAVVYLKWSHFGQNPLKGMLASTTLHSSFNAGVIALIVLTGSA